jgi:hypothetical protein
MLLSFNDHAKEIQNEKVIFDPEADELSSGTPTP